jgi:hypothetical protein
MVSPAGAAAARPKPKPPIPVPITIALSARPATATWNTSDEVVDYRRWRRDRHRGGVDGGDVLGGLLIIGVVAAAAAAIDKDKQERRRDRTEGRDYPYPQRPYDYRDDDRYREQSPDYGRAGGDPRGADRAVDACTAEAARTGRVDEIFDVEKVGGEWRVRGDFTNGREFTCSVDANGRAYVGTDWSADADPRPEIGVDEDDRYAAGANADWEDRRGR